MSDNKRFNPCGEGNNICSCKNENECGYKYMAENLPSDNVERTEFYYAGQWASEFKGNDWEICYKSYYSDVENMDNGQALLFIFRKEVIEPFAKEKLNFDVTKEYSYEYAFERYRMEVLEKQNPAEQTEKKTDSPKINFPVQFGKSFTADFEENTWTFEMKEDYEVVAGKFAIVPIDKYHELTANQQNQALLSEVEALDNEIKVVNPTSYEQYYDAYCKLTDGLYALINKHKTK